MDNTEIHYLTYDPDEMWNAMTEAYFEAGGDPLWPGDEKEILLRGAERILFETLAGVDHSLRMATLRYAVGEYLDIYGEARDCYRLTATAATAEITVTLRATGVEGTIPAGSALTADGETMYSLDSDLQTSGAAETLTATVTCTEAGSKGNGLAAGTQMQFVSAWDGVTDVRAATAASGGQDTEDDDTYRDRIRTYGLSAVTTGPAGQYRSAAMAVSSEIIDAAALNRQDIEPGYAGVDDTVYVYLLLAEGANSAELISAVTEALNPKSVRPLNDRLSVSTAIEKTYTLEVQYATGDIQNIASAVETAVEEYKEWQEETIGRAFNPDKLKAALYSAGCSRVVFGSGSAFNGGAAEYTEIGKNEVCKGTITTAVISG